MIKPDDSSLDPEDLRAVEAKAHKLLDRASAWGRFPTPIDDIVAAANLRVAPKSIFDLQGVVAYLTDKAAAKAHNLKSALGKILGLCDSDEQIIHIDESVVATKQNFLKLHETGHHELPTHRKLFKLFQECEKTLDPAVADQFEREANNFARFALFQGDTYARRACDLPLSIKSPMAMAKDFSASQYASAREFARTNHRSCVVYILEPAQFVPGRGFQAAVRRIEPSPLFLAQFGKMNDKMVTPDHFLGRVVPIGRRMSRPTAISLTDRNGVRHECVAEAFDTTHNILILLYPVAALTKTTIILPNTFS
ncbi:ImmA/IrrE family metallo-endopeptidase [Rhodopseudomonas sp.]|uniref:ImmA/IrrE family metallo-endopeptidase n=1 Tax=Rhodopseudomonas sp. TaxID=1078 RepID=UPI0039E6F4E5